MFARTLISCLLFACVAAHAKEPPTTGSICGTFEDENGQPAAHTLIAALYLGGHSGPIPAAKTDAHGHYCLADLSLGEYMVSADDESKGYPALNVLFFAAHSPEPIVTLSAAAPHARFGGSIPYTAGFLSVLLTDAEDGKPIPSMSVRLAVRSNPDLRSMHRGTASDTIMLIPPNEDIYLNVSSPGFEKWPDDGSKGMLLSFAPGQKQTLSLSLRRIR